MQTVISVLINVSVPVWGSLGAVLLVSLKEQSRAEQSRTEQRTGQTDKFSSYPYNIPYSLSGHSQTVNYETEAIHANVMSLLT